MRIKKFLVKTTLPNLELLCSTETAGCKKFCCTSEFRQKILNTKDMALEKVNISFLYRFVKLFDFSQKLPAKS